MLFTRITLSCIVCYITYRKVQPTSGTSGTCIDHLSSGEGSL